MRPGTTLQLADARRAGYYNIGEAAADSGVSPKMIRHYESLGLLKTPRRTEAGYRLYDVNAIHTLTFVRRARELGFAMPQIQQLLGLWQNRRRTSAEVRPRVAQPRLEELDAKIAQLQAMRRTLEQLVQHRHGDGRPECPILDDLAGSPERKG